MSLRVTPFLADARASRRSPAQYGAGGACVGVDEWQRQPELQLAVAQENGVQCVAPRCRPQRSVFAPAAQVYHWEQGTVVLRPCSLQSRVAAAPKPRSA